MFSALRGPPLDENLLLSNIATANKKVEHLTEVRFTVKDLTDARGLFLILGTQAGPLNIDQETVVQTLGSAIHRINHYPADSVIDFRNTYPLDSDLSGG